MTKLRYCLLFAAVLLVGCDHHKSAGQAQAEAGSAAVKQDDSDLTGMPSQSTNSSTKPSYPRAQLVSLPPSAQTSKPAAPAPATTPPADNPSTASTSTSASETVATTSTTPPADRPSTPSPAASPASSDNDSSMTRLTPTAPNPEPATNPPAAASDDPTQEQVVVLNTSFGRIVIELDNSAAPVTCENFRRLVSDGFYNHTAFHRIIPNFIIQGGDPNTLGRDRATYGLGGPNYKLPAEINLTHDVGAVAMARLPDSVNPKRESNGSQFYICVTACPSLDAQYTVFGHVIKGMEVVSKISSQPRDSRDDPLSKIEMEATLESKSTALANDVPNQ